jgi:hypothetical protein
MELELELLESGYNADLMKDEMEAFWIRIRRASESSSSRVLPSVAHNPPDGTGEE